MNRKERRAARKRGQGGALPGGGGVEEMFALSVQHHQRGQLAEAEAVGRAILSRDPRHIGTIHLLGMIAQQRRSHGEAAAYFRDLLRLRPDVADAHYRLGHALAGLGQCDEAVKSIERARELDTDPRTRRAAEMTPDYAWTYFNLGNLCVGRRQFAEAEMLFNRSLALGPDVADVHNSFGALLVEQGRLAEASAQFARALAFAPELLNTYADLRAALFTVSPAVKAAVARAADAWPRRLSLEGLFGTADWVAVTAEPLLLAMLESGPVRDIELERFLTALRAALLEIAAGGDPVTADANALRFACTMAQQCFSNEYVFLADAEELDRAQQLRERLSAALRSGAFVPPLWPAAVSCYFSLHTLADAETLLARDWPDPLARVLTQQIREVWQERQYRDEIPRLTAIEDTVSVRVRQQYEENPYPRWIVAGSRPKPQTVEDYFRQKFPMAQVRPVSGGGNLDVLVAGCGTGQHPIGLARTFRNARVLAVDLSLASLSYALRKTRELGLHNLEYAQADLLLLGSLGRSFDVIDSSGVLHHLADPMAGWRALLSLVRPRGIMGIGLYSELGRREITAAQRFVADRGYRPTAEDIRRCRHELLDGPHRSLAKVHDMFTTSECRDLLFHVQEHHFTIPQIKEFLASHQLELIGFELGAAEQQAYRARFPEDQSTTDLDRWHTFETERPETFAGMYQFWCQRP
jgi:Tfp pilus assembly protein PilF/SAM-dependent methyltransferase